MNPELIYEAQDGAKYTIQVYASRIEGKYIAGYHYMILTPYQKGGGGSGCLQYEQLGKHETIQEAEKAALNYILELMAYTYQRYPHLKKIINEAMGTIHRRLSGERQLELF